MLKRVAFDIECDGLDATKIHSLVLLDLDTDQLYSYADQDGYAPIQEGVSVLRSAKLLVGHNILKFDAPVIQRLYNVKLRGGLYDTLIAARTAYPDLMMFDCETELPTKIWGRHSLAAWGHRIGIFKGEFGQDDEQVWDEWSAEMQQYCEQDVRVTAALYRWLQQEQLPAESLKIEHTLARYLLAQEVNGFPFDREAGEKLAAHLAAEEERLLVELKSYFGMWVKRGEYVIPKSNRGKIGDKKSTLFRVAKGCSYCKMEIHEYTGGPDQTKAALKRLYGWEPNNVKKRKRIKGEMEVVVEEEGTDEVTLSKLNFPAIPSLIKYNNVRKIRGMLETGKNAWLKLFRPETGCIHGQVNQNGTVTHRATHNRPNISQVPSGKRPYGKECRELFHAPPGWTVVGTDASGLELRMLAHYMHAYDNGRYGNVILNGDIHTENMRAAGLANRNQAKSFIYGYLYGAGAVKLGSIASPDADERKQGAVGAALKKSFLQAIPALAQVIEDCTTEAAEHGYVRSIDGRKTYVKSAHKALNCLLQSSGSILVKKWISLLYVSLTEKYGAPSWNGVWTPLSFSHDDIIIAVKNDYVAEIQKIKLDSITQAGLALGVQIRMDGESKTGSNWYEVH
jgi:DNA polymerase I-like protein with 3'-5' exonuclease and polymerase domains